MCMDTRNVIRTQRDDGQATLQLRQPLDHWVAQLQDWLARLSAVDWAKCLDLDK